MEFNFGENLVVEDISRVPQDFQGLYIQNEEGKYALNNTDPAVKSAVSAITKLNSALVNERKTKKTAVDLTPLKEFGESPEDILRNFNQKIEEAKIGADKDTKLNLEKIKQEFAQTHAKDLQSKDGKIEALTQQLYNRLVIAEATSAIAEAKGLPELVMPFVRDQVKVVEVEGKLYARVVDSSGDIRFSGVTGEPMTIGELVKELKGNEKFGRLFESEAPNGGGAKGTNQTKTPNKPTGELSPTQKISAGLQKLR